MQAFIEYDQVIYQRSMDADGTFGNIPYSSPDPTVAWGLCATAYTPGTGTLVVTCRATMTNQTPPANPLAVVRNTIETGVSSRPGSWTVASTVISNPSPVTSTVLTNSAEQLRLTMDLGDTPMGMGSSAGNVTAFITITYTNVLPGQIFTILVDPQIQIGILAAPSPLGVINRTLVIP